MSEKPETEPPPIQTAYSDPESSEFQNDYHLYDAQEKTKQLKGLFASRVYIQPEGRHLRISFGERVGDEFVYHTTVVMPVEEAQQAGELMHRMATASLAQFWDRVAKAFESPAAPEGPSNG